MSYFYFITAWLLCGAVGIISIRSKELDKDYRDIAESRLRIIEGYQEHFLKRNAQMDVHGNIKTKEQL